MAEPMDWTEYLNEEDVDIPLHALRYSCIQRISFYLNKQIQPRPGMRYIPNFGGLGELIGLDGVQISEMARRENPGFSVLDCWKEYRRLNPTIGNLVKYLVILGRRDILTDTADLIQTEIKDHKDRLLNLQQQIQVETVSSDHAMEEANRILTIDDVKEGIAIYDAFVCFDIGDLDFVRAMIAKLEGPEFGFRFFIPGRNSLVGTNSNQLTTQIISERCRHMIVVLSNSFLQSSACEFQTAYAFALNPGARDKKIVPIKIEECHTPEILKIMAYCDFTNRNLLDWSWNRLALSIMCPMPNPDFLGPQRFVPPPRAGMALGRLGAAEVVGRPMAPSNDSGISSLNSERAGGASSVPSSSLCPPCQPEPASSASASSSNSSVGLGLPTASISSPSSSHAPPPNSRRDKTSSPVSQAFKRFTQTLAPSKIQKKKHKGTKGAEATS